MDHVSSPARDTPVQEVFSRLLAGHQLTVSGRPSSSSAT